jgi:hypothetical protein
MKGPLGMTERAFFLPTGRTYSLRSSRPVNHYLIRAIFLTSVYDPAVMRQK